MTFSGSTFKFAGVWLLSGVMLLGSALIKPVQDRIWARLENRAADPDLLYFATPGAVRKIALGYEGLLADIYWMRTIQYYGQRDKAERRKVRYKNLAALLDITVALDPRMLDVYRYGSLFLSEADPVGAGRPEAALKLLDKGIALHPEGWQLRYDKGLIYFWFLKDYQAAGQVWLEASRLASAPFWMESLAASALSTGGAIETARSLWQRQYEESKREDIRENAMNHLLSIRVDENLWTLEFFIEKYLARFGSNPENLQDLVRAGYLKYIPADPANVPYMYDSVTGIVWLSPRSTVHYVALPYSYRETFRENLFRLYGSP